MITSRERIRLALNHKEADRIPIDLGAFRSSGIAAIAYNRLRKKLGINSKLPRMYDFIQQLTFPEREIMDMFHVDVIDAAQAFLEENSKWRKWTLDDGTECLIPKNLNIEIGKDQTVYLKNKEGIILGKKPKSSLYVDQAWRPYENLDKIPENVTDDDVVKEMWSIPGPEWSFNIFIEDHYNKFIENIKSLHENTDYAILLIVGCNLFEKGTYLRNFENFLVDIYTDKKGVERLHAKLMERYMKILDRVIKGVGKYIDILAFGGDDLGSNDGGFMSPDIFKEMFKPKYKKMWDFVHDNSECKIFLHSCGSIYEYIPDLIDAGVDILNPVQTNAAKMEPERLKKEFGKYVTFWGGGVDTRNVLPNKSPDEVKEDVRRRIEIFGKGGGFVFNQIHNILADVPPENVIAMLEAAYEYGSYNK